jgi:hypothetical protein
VSYTPLEQLAPSTPSQVVAQEGDTLRSIAARVYGDESLWYLIADENGEVDPDGAVSPGRMLTIPSRVVSLANNAESFKPFDIQKAIGDVTPTQATPPPQLKNGCGFVGMVIVVVVAIIASVYLGPEVGTALVEAVGATSATGIAVATGVGYGIAAGIGSAVGQGIAMAVGAQEKFSWESVAATALTAGILKGVGVGPVAGEVTSTPQMLVNGAVASVVNQGVNVALGLQDSFNWRELAISSVSSAVAGKLTAGIDNKMNQAVVGGFTSAAVRRALGGRVEVDAVLADVFANVIGNSIVAKLHEQEVNLTAGMMAGVAPASQAAPEAEQSSEWWLDMSSS